MFCHPEDASIITEGDEKVLIDCDGDTLQTFPSDWSDENIFRALTFANYAYETGRKIGRCEKAREIKNALEEGDLNQ